MHESTPTQPTGRRALSGLAPLVGFLVLLIGIALPASSAQAAPDATTTLAERYAPIVVVREQPEPCGEGEPFRPTPVTTVLGRPDVVLRGPNGEQVASPTAQDLVGRDAGWYLDYPGNPLAPQCDYEKWFRQASQGTTPTLYSRIATDPDHPDSSPCSTGSSTRSTTGTTSTRATGRWCRSSSRRPRRSRR